MKPALTPADRRKQGLRRLRMLLVTIGSVVLYAALLWPIRTSVTDDTYIHLVYAKHFRDGLGLLFNVGQPVFGTTSPLWSLGLGLLGRTGLDLLLLARGLSMLFGALSIVAFAVFLRRFLESWVSETGYGAGRSEVAWAFGTLVFALDVWLVRWSATGMETACATFLVVAGFASYVSRRPWGNRVLVPATWWSFAALARPEVSVLLVLLLLRVLLTHGPLRVKLVRAGWVLLPIAIVHGAWLTYALTLYHTAIPATLAAKTAGGTGARVFVDLLLRQGKAMIAARGIEVLVLVAFAPLLVTRLWVRRADHFLPVSWLLGLPLLYAARGVPAISRYLVPILPLVVAYAWGTLAWLAAGVRRRPALAVAGLALAGALSLANSLYTYVRFVVPQADAFSRDVDGTLGALGRWCRTHTPPGTEIAIPDIGAFAYFADRPVVDLVGLVTPGITPLLRRYPYDDLVTNLRFEGVARPPYLIDRADMPRRMLFQSPYAPCLTVILVGRVDQRGIQHPEPAYYTLYRIDWVAFDKMAGGERRALLRPGPRPESTPLSAGAEDRLPGMAGDAGPASRSGLLAADDSAPAREKSFRLLYGRRGGAGNLIDTKAGTLIYDRVSEPDTIVEMRWTQAQLDSMREAAIALRIMDLPEPHPWTRVRTDSTTGISLSPTSSVLEIEIDGRQKHFEWTDTVMIVGVPWNRDNYMRLLKFRQLLDDMIARHPAVRALAPTATGNK